MGTTNVLRAAAGENPLYQIVKADQFAGFVYRMDFDHAYVLTNDRWKHAVGGIPMNSILVATAANLANPAATPEDAEELVILRVVGSEPLPSDSDMVKSHIERHQRRVTNEIEDDEVYQTVTQVRDGIDEFSLAHMQFGGLKCRIIGTMFERDGALRMGADIENFPSVAHHRIYKPVGHGLWQIINYTDPDKLRKADEEAKRMGFAKAPEPVAFGRVKWTSTETKRPTSLQSLTDVEVVIRPFDILARRTGIFGMTRTGKSNTTKTLVSEIALAAISGERKVGQLIFDMNGEYANANGQDDGSSIADVFTHDVVRYRGVRMPAPWRDLRNNFFDEHSLPVGLALIQAMLKADKSMNSADAKTFMNMNLDEPEKSDRSAQNRWAVKKAAYRCMLDRAQFQHNGLVIEFPIGKLVLDQIYKVITPTATQQKNADARVADLTVAYGDPNDGMAPDRAFEFFRLIRRAHLALCAQQLNSGKPEIGLESSSKNAWVDAELMSMLNLLFNENSNGSYQNGSNSLMKYRDYHSAGGSRDVAQEVYKELVGGKIVILDLSVGTEDMRKNMARDVAKYVFTRSMNLFASESGIDANGNSTLPHIVLYVEEAHNLIGKDAPVDDVWPRLAKEGAKFRIGLIYATQEPSSVQKNVLANTENIFVTHLSTDDEIGTVSKFYDFEDYAKSIKKAQDPGFARVKTLSGNFVVPIQIKLFDPKLLQTKIGQLRSSKSV